MRKVILILVAAVLAFAAVGCNDGSAATPRPSASIRPAASPSLAPVTTAPMTTAPMSPDITGGTGGNGGTIEGFVDGNSVDVTALPKAVTDAVLEKYPGATISAASYATYMSSQMYLLTLSGASDNTERVYASADGTITQYSATPTGE